MKAVAVVVLSLVLVATMGVTGFAQPGDGPANPETKPAGPAEKHEPTTPPKASDQTLDADPRTTVPEAPSSSREAGGTRVDDSADVSALPRSAMPERTTLFGLSPMAALLLAGAVLLIVGVAIVALTRSKSIHLENDRR